MISAQQWLDENYPQDKREELTDLGLIGGGFALQGSLKIEGFTKLEGIYCQSNQLTSLEIVACPNLKILNCSGNLLTKLEFDGCYELTQLKCYDNYLTNLNLSQNKKLQVLDIASNNFFSQDLSFLNHLVNLVGLWLGNDTFFSSGDNQICFIRTKENYINAQYPSSQKNEEFYNRFTGSLKPLRSLTKLSLLSISNTNINEGLEYLPLSLKEFFCRAVDDEVKIKRPRCRQIQEQLLQANDPNHLPVFFGDIKNANDNLVPLLKEWRKWKIDLFLDSVKSFYEESLEKLKQEKFLLKNEIDIEREHAKNLDEWYRRQLPTEDKFKGFDDWKEKLNSIVEFSRKEFLEKNLLKMKKIYQQRNYLNKEIGKTNERISEAKIELEELKNSIEDKKKELRDLEKKETRTIPILITFVILATLCVIVREFQHIKKNYKK